LGDRQEIVVTFRPVPHLPFGDGPVASDVLRLGLDPEFDAHLYHQSKHGTRKRAPIGKAEEFVAHMLAQEPARLDV